LKRKSFLYVFVLFAVTVFAVGLLLFPEETSESGNSALRLCAKNIIPSLLPFFVLSKLITNLKFTDIVAKILSGVMQPLFSVSGSGAAAFAIGAVGGYPVGAMTCASLYKSKLCSKSESERLLSFCNMCGPAFIIGTVGYGIFNSATVGILLYVIHLSAAIITGITMRIIRPLKKTEAYIVSSVTSPVPCFSFAFTDAVSSALKSSLSISAYIVLFSILVTVFQKFFLIQSAAEIISSVFGFNPIICEGLASGILEVTVGIFSLASVADFRMLFVFCAFLLGWGGLSVHCQTVSCLEDTDLSLRTYFIGKILHGIISALLAYVISATVSLSTAIEAIAASAIASKSHSFTCIYILPVIALIYIFCKKGWKKA